MAAGFSQRFLICENKSHISKQGEKRERFGPLVKNGQHISIWNEDGGTNSDQAYKNIPFYLTSRGYGVFVNSPGKVDFEIGTERVNQVQISVPGEGLDYYIFYGPDPKDVLDKYTRLTGRPAVRLTWRSNSRSATSFTQQPALRMITVPATNTIRRCQPG